MLLDMVDFSESRAILMELYALKASPLLKLAVILGSKFASWRLGDRFGDPFGDIDCSSALPSRLRRLFARSITFLLKRYGKAITL